MEQQKSAEAVVGWLPPTEGLNIGYESEHVDSMRLRTTARAKNSPIPKREARSLRGTARLCSTSRHQQEQLRAGLI